MRVLDLFSGIGGFSLGLERAGMTTVAFCEIDPFCRRVLAKHWPAVPIFEDVRRMKGSDVEAVDVICGGFPCQDISYAGLGSGIHGERSGLWREYARLVGEVRPRYVLVENVSALLRRGLDVVLGDLAALGFDAEWHCIPASAVGAPHIRDRIWIIAYPPPVGRGQGWTRRPSASPSRESELAFPTSSDAPQVLGHSFFREQQDRALQCYWPQDWPAHIESLRGLDDGFSDEVGELGGYGNAVVPAIPEIIGRAIMAAEAA